jgi:DnaJ-domain-containing protein 1
MNVCDEHGGSLDLKNIFGAMKTFFSKKKKPTKKQQEEEPKYYGYDPNGPKEPPKYEHKKPEQPKPQQAPPRRHHEHEQHYATLGLTSNASPEEEVRKAYRRLSLKYHPDKNVGNEERASEEFQKVNHAYSTITGRGIKRKYARRK